MYKLSLKEHNRRMKLYKKGFSDKEIGKKVNRISMTIFKWRERNNLKATPKKAWNKGKTGLHQAWNKGLTKDTDKRVKKYAEKVKRAKKIFPHVLVEKYQKHYLENIVEKTIGSGEVVENVETHRTGIK